METVEEIKQHLVTGDLKKVAKLTGLTHDNVRKILKRPKAKRFRMVFEAAKFVAQFNEKMGL